MRLKVKQIGNLSKTVKFLKAANRFSVKGILDRYGKEGVSALRANTPKDTGLTSECWDYAVELKGNKARLYWFNTNMAGSVPVVILLQYGHGTVNGRFIPGRDFINPAIKPIFDKISNDIWKEVKAL